MFAGARIAKAGKTTFDFDDRPRTIHPFARGKIVKIASGAQHSLALDEEGYLWAFGFAGYSRLGLGDQKDRLVDSPVVYTRDAKFRVKQVDSNNGTTILNGESTE